MTDSQLFIRVTDTQTLEQWVFDPANGHCPVLEKGMTGDGAMTWTAEFTQFQDRRPPRFALVEAIDDQGLVQTGRLVRFAPPGTDLCTGPCNYMAEGFAAAGRDRKDTDPRPYGPVYTGTTRGLTPEAAVTDAVARWNGVSIGTVSPSGFTLPDTESFQGRSPMDVANAMAQFGAGLATPFVWSVKKGLFTWGPLSLGARYQTLIADDAIIVPTDDASRLYDHVIVLWGQGQYAEYPTTLSYAQIPTQVTLSVNAGAEVKTPAAALQLAQGLYARLNELELGWSWNFTIPGDTAVELIGSGPINPWRVEAASVLRVPDFEPVNRYGEKHPSPSQLVITSLRWDGNANQLTGTCGEIRDPSQFVKQVMYASNFSISSPFSTKPNIMRTVRDAGKITYFGPFISTATATSTNAVAPGPATLPARIDHGIPAIDTKHRTLHPSDLPPIPPVLVFHDASPTSSGIKMKMIVPPLKTTKWTLATPGAQSNYRMVVTRRSNGATIADMDLAGSSEKIDQAIGSTAVNSTVGVIEKDDLLIWTVVTPAASSGITFVDSGIRTVRFYPDYAGSQAPMTGTTATAT